MRRKFLGFEQQTDSFCTNEREYPLRLNTSQSHFIWWLAARQEMLSSSKYFLNTTKYLYKSPSPGFWGRKTEVQRGRHSTETQWTLGCPMFLMPGLSPRCTGVTCSRSRPGPGTGHMRSIGRCQYPVLTWGAQLTSVELRTLSSAEWSDQAIECSDIGNPSYRVHMRLREAIGAELIVN